MPNWVTNKIKITGNSDKIAELLAKASTDFGPFDFNGIVPTPDDVYQGPLGQKEMEKYPGLLNWYDWNCHFWGTKWNACEANVVADNEVAYVQFETAWDAPIPIYEAMHEQYPELDVYVKFADEDIGYNAGIWHNGKLQYIEDDAFSCDVWGMDYADYKSECEEYLKNNNF